MMPTSTNSTREHGWGESIPSSLCDRPQWVVTHNKKPIREGWNNSENQFSFQQARRMAEHRNGEPAYVLQGNDPFVVIDLDDIGPAVPTTVSEEASKIVQQFETYTEASRSDTGLHLVCEGTRLPDRGKKGNLHDQGSIEVFDENQYVVLTGNHIEPYDTIRDGHAIGDKDRDVLVNLQREYLPVRSGTVETEGDRSSFDLETVSSNSVNVTVDDIRRTIKAYAKDGRPEAKRALKRWNSPAGSSCGFPSASEADLGFVADLAFWCRGDANLIDDCFQASNRMREKWHQICYSDGRTYGEGTIQTAVRSNYDTFSGHYVQHYDK